MILQEARQFALSLPEATEMPHFDMTSFRVGGKIFATAPPDGEHLHVFLDEHKTRASVAEAPQAFAELWWGKRLVGVRVHLSASDAQTVVELLEDAWRRRAPRRAVALLDDPTRSRPAGLTAQDAEGTDSLSAEDAEDADGTETEGVKR